MELLPSKRQCLDAGPGHSSGSVILDTSDSRTLITGPSNSPQGNTRHLPLWTPLPSASTVSGRHGASLPLWRPRGPLHLSPSHVYGTGNLDIPPSPYRQKSLSDDEAEAATEGVLPMGMPSVCTLPHFQERINDTSQALPVQPLTIPDPQVLTQSEGIHSQAMTHSDTDSDSDSETDRELGQLVLTPQLPLETHSKRLLRDWASYYQCDQDVGAYAPRLVHFPVGPRCQPDVVGYPEANATRQSSSPDYDYVRSPCELADATLHHFKLDKSHVGLIITSPLFCNCVST